MKKKISILLLLLVCLSVQAQKISVNKTDNFTKSQIVLPGVGPLGIENSWVVTADGVEKLTLCKEEIIEM